MGTLKSKRRRKARNGIKISSRLRIRKVCFMWKPWIITPGNVVELLVVSNELGTKDLTLDVPDGAHSIKGSGGTIEVVVLVIVEEAFEIKPLDNTTLFRVEKRKRSCCWL